MAAQNFKDQDLTGTDFSDQDLAYSLFRGANLTNCNFNGADVSGCNFRECNMTGATFVDTIGYYMNDKDSTGSPDWSNARCYGSPKHIAKPTADYKGKPYIGADNADPLFIQVFEQIEHQTLEDVHNKDHRAMQKWTAGDGYHPSTKIKGSYQSVFDANGLYALIPNIPIGSSAEDVLNECMTNNVTFENGSFVIKP